MNQAEEQDLLRETVRQFAIREVAPRAAEWDAAETVPQPLLERAADLGLLGLTIPEQYGGGGLGAVPFAGMLEELARVDGGFAIYLLIHCGVATKAIWHFGSEEVKRRLLPQLAAGKQIAAFAQTEPDAGSDVGNLSTTAEPDGDYFVLNGSKSFISNGGIADVYTVMVKMDQTRSTRGIGAIVVERGTPGFEVVREMKKLGLRGSSTAELLFTNCRVPRENLLVRAPDGFKQMMGVFNSERVGNAAVCLGIARGAHELALQYVQERQAFGRPVADNQGVRWMLADMATQIHAARLMVYEAARRVDAGLPVIFEASAAKLFCNEMARRVTDDALQLHGGYGFTREYAVERFVRDARFGGVAGGTTQILRNVIAAQLLGATADQVAHRER